jgi:hypothetical protein
MLHVSGSDMVLPYTGSAATAQAEETAAASTRVVRRIVCISITSKSDGDLPSERKASLTPFDEPFLGAIPSSLESAARHPETADDRVIGFRTPGRLRLSALLRRVCIKKGGTGVPPFVIYCSTASLPIAVPKITERMS